MAKDKSDVILIEPDKKLGLDVQADTTVDGLFKNGVHGDRVWALGAAFMASPASISTLEFRAPSNIKDPAKIRARIAEAQAKIIAAPEQRLFVADHVSCFMTTVQTTPTYVLTDVKLILAFIAEICYRKGVIFTFDALQRIRALACCGLERGYTTKLYAILSLSYIYGRPVGLVDPLSGWLSTTRSEEETTAMLAVLGLPSQDKLARGNNLEEKAVCEGKAIASIVESLGLVNAHRRFITQ